jgi:hypothetical protein
MAEEMVPMRVGEAEPLNIGTLHPYGTGTGDAAQKWVVHYPGATYIRVHFNRFDLAPGDYLEVFDANGLQYNSYTGGGIHGTGDFWAFALAGDTAILQLQSSTGGGFGFEADRFGRGTVPYVPDPVQPESVCGALDWRDVECYKSSYPTEYEKAKGAVKLLIGAGSACTGFKASDSGQFMTNNHCTGTDTGVKSTQVIFEYQRPGCDSGTATDTGSVMGSSLVSTDYTLDYTLMTTSGDSSSIPCLNIDDRLAPEGERMYIAGHPSAGPKKLSIESDMNAGGLCFVDNSPHPGRDSTSDIGYYCDTTNGSSGSPVLSGDTHNVIAIHHYGGCLNSGVRMDRILNDIGNKLDTCEGGGGGECGDGTCDPGENECNCPGDCGDPPTSEAGMCDDGIDNDCGGGTDCDDADCADDPVCGTPTCAAKGEPCAVNSDCCSNRCFTHPRRGTYCK